MKKALFIVFLCSVVMLLSVPQATALDTAPTINVQVSIEEAGIDLSGYNWTTGTLALSATASSPPFTVTNIGTVPVDLTIDSGDTMWQAPQTGPDWTCSVSGPNTFAMGFDIAGTAPGTDICPGGFHWPPVCSQETLLLNHK